MEEEIKAEFNKSGFSLIEEEDILKKCLTFCINYNLDPSDLVSSWEVYFINRQQNEPTVHDAQMDGFLLHLQNEQKEAFIKDESHLHVYSSNDVDMILNEQLEDVKDGLPSTPTDGSNKPHSPDSINRISGSNTPSGKQSKLVTPFGQRTNKFVVQFTVNNLPKTDNQWQKDNVETNDDDIIRRVQSSKRCSLQIIKSEPEPGCRFMYDRIEDRFNSLENRIRKHTTRLVSSGLHDEPTDPTVAAQKSIFAVGMICCDGEGHLNEKSILLQSSIEHSAGRRVRLDVQHLSQYSLFPGQVVGIEGNNPSGHCLIASKLIDHIPFSVSVDGLPPAKKRAMGQQTDPSRTMAELSMIIAAGPFTTTDNLLFEPLSELLAYASRRLPQLLLLLGPFIDSEHPVIKNGTVDKTFEEIFSQEILRRLQDYTEYMGSAVRIILVPSTRDANHDFVFPQPAFDIQPPHLKDQITSLSNPGVFDANEVKVGCCTVDIVRHLSGEEISRNSMDGSSGDRMSRLANHILRQHSFYPLYPPSESVPLDYSLAPEALQISSIPDILVLPSDLAPFVKVLSLDGMVEGEEQVQCMCVNPGRLAKGMGGGTFLELNYLESPDSTTVSVIRI